MPPSEPVLNINPENKEIKTLRETCKSLRDQVRELEDVINKQASDSVKLKVNKNIYMYMYIFFGLHLHSKFSLKGFPRGGDQLLNIIAHTGSEVDLYILWMVE